MFRASLLASLGTGHHPHWLPWQWNWSPRLRFEPSPSPGPPHTHAAVKIVLCASRFIWDMLNLLCIPRSSWGHGSARSNLDNISLWFPPHTLHPFPARKAALWMLGGAVWVVSTCSLYAVGCAPGSRNTLAPSSCSLLWTLMGRGWLLSLPLLPSLHTVL